MAVETLPTPSLSSDGIGSPIYIDGGNADVKFVAGESYSSFRHALAELTRAEYLQIGEDANAFNPDLVQVTTPQKQRYFVVGETAQSLSHVTSRTGRPKYERDYYGVFFASVVGRLYHEAGRKLSQLRVFASYAPDDDKYTEDLKASVQGNWRIIVGGAEHGVPMQFVVDKVSTYKEPYGGYLCENYQWSNTRNCYAPTLLGKRVAGIDIGGGTHSSFWIDAEGKQSRARSNQGGINAVVDTFRANLEADKELKYLFKDMPSIPDSLLREGLRDGYMTINKQFSDASLNEKWFVRGTNKIKVDDIAARSCVSLLNNVMNMWMNQLRGGGETDVVLLMGGGGGMLGKRLIEMLNMRDVRYAGGNVNLIQFANVFGPKRLNEPKQGR